MRTEDKDVQLVIPDAFDIDYVEMFTSTRGYAGIQKVNQFVCSNYGYIFYLHNIYSQYLLNASLNSVINTDDLEKIIFQCLEKR